MDDNILISVIVPVYNGEKTLRRAVDSVLCQMDGRIELILVDDGSKDESGTICDEYAERYADIRVIHKKNGGLSSARNAGIEAAAGEYLCFLDADDYLDIETCSSLINVIKANAPDMIDFGWKYISSSGEVSANRHSVPKGILLDENAIKDMILPPLLNLRKDDEHFIYDFACTKVFRSDIIRLYNIRFDEMRRVWEDRPFSVTYLRYCKTFFSVSECFYNYVDMPNSLSRRFHLEFFDVILKNYKLYKLLFADSYDFDTPYVNEYWATAIENMIFRALEQKTDREQILNIILETLRNELVVYWFANRIPNNAFEKKLRELVSTGQTKEALFRYEKRVAQRHRKQALQNAKVRIVRVIRRFTRR